MHGRGVVHGDLKGVRTRKPQLCPPLMLLIFQLNILVDQTCRAKLADFGLLTIIPDSSSVTSRAQGGTIRWMSPELLDLEIQGRHQTIYSDCYALGMVIYEVLSERTPFYQSPDWAIPGKVSNGDRPERPQGVEGVWFTDDVWEVLRHCWMPQPEDRPSIKDLLQCLEEVSRSWTPPSVPLTAGLPTEEFSDILIVESTDVGGMPPLSHVAPHQPSVKPEPEEAAETVSGVCCVPSTSSSIQIFTRYPIRPHLTTSENIHLFVQMTHRLRRVYWEGLSVESSRRRMIPAQWMMERPFQTRQHDLMPSLQREAMTTLTPLQRPS